MGSTIRPPISYQGNKYELINDYQINEYIPPTNTTHPFSEVFGGSFTMFYNLSNCTCAFLNDINSELINFWIQIQKHQVEFEERLKYVWCGNEFITELEKEPTDINRAVIYYLKNRMGTYIKFPKPLEKDLSPWKARLDETRVLLMNYDYEIALDMVCRVRNTEIGKNFYMVIYEDPPYYKLLSNYQLDDKFDHQRLFELNQKYADDGHHIILSYNKCDEIETLYKNWYKLEFPMRHYNSEIEKRVELLLSNKPFKRYINKEKFKQQKSLNGMIKRKKNE